MKILRYVLLGMAISYGLLILGNIGILLLGGAIFGLLLFIAVTLNQGQKQKQNPEPVTHEEEQ